MLRSSFIRIQRTGGHQDSVTYSRCLFGFSEKSMLISIFREISPCFREANVSCEALTAVRKGLRISVGKNLSSHTEIYVWEVCNLTKPAAINL